MMQNKSRKKPHNKPHSHKIKQKRKQFKGDISKNIKQKSKEERFNETRQIALQKRREMIEAKRALLSSRTEMSEEMNSLLDEVSSKIISPPIIVSIIQMSDKTNIEEFRQILEKIFLQMEGITIESKTPYLIIECKKSISKFAHLNKNKKITFLFPERNIDSIIKNCSISDLICPLFSCSKTDLSKMSIDPHNSANAYDDFGYKSIQIIRSIGISHFIGIIQHLENIKKGKIKDVIKLFNRFYSSEFIDDKPLIQFEPEKMEENIRKLVIQIMAINNQDYSWRSNRSFINVEKIDLSMEKGVIYVSGYLNGNSLNPNQLMFLSDTGIFQISDIQVAKNRNSPLLSNPFFPDSSKQETLYPFSKQIITSPISNNEEKKMEIEAQIIDKNMEECIDLVENMEIGGQNIDNEDEEREAPIINESDEEDSEEDEDIDEAELNLPSSKKHLEATKLKPRSKEEMDFPEEVDTPSDMLARDRFKKFIALKILDKKSWNLTKNVPEEYNYIFNYKNAPKYQNYCFKMVENAGMKISGCFCQLSIKTRPDIVMNNFLKYPIICSNVFPDENKISVITFKIKSIIPNFLFKSKDTFIIDLGLKRLEIKPIFSSIIRSNGISRFIKQFNDDQYYLATVYSEISYIPQNIILHKKEGNQLVPVAIGNIYSINTNILIIKRIILTGYPFKVNKTHAIVRYMFFNPSDVTYFKEVPLSTKKGLKGSIIKSVGTHGLFKCKFSDTIQSDDIVCLSLYKRVFPVWTFVNVSEKIIEKMIDK